MAFISKNIQIIPEQLVTYLELAKKFELDQFKKVSIFEIKKIDFFEKQIFLLIINLRLLNLISKL